MTSLMYMTRRMCAVTASATHACVPEHRTASWRELKGLQHFLDQHKRIYFITGAGLSTESGIPDYRGERSGRFRGDQRLLKKSVTTIQQFMKSDAVRRRYWARSYVAWPAFSAKQPNRAHAVLAEWEARVPHRIQHLVTQNVDNLHYAAGNRNATELHGSLFRVRCLGCDRLTDRHAFQEYIRQLNPGWEAGVSKLRPDGDVELPRPAIESFTTPHCPDCDGLVRPDVVFFGDNVPSQTTRRVMDRLNGADALVVLGTTLEALSVFRIVVAACRQERGLPIVVVNIGDTAADAFADIKIEARVSDVLSRVEL